MSCKGEAKPETVSEKRLHIALMAEALNTMLKLVEKGLGKYCSAAGIGSDEMDTMVKNIKELHEKYNK